MSEEVMNDGAQENTEAPQEEQKQTESQESTEQDVGEKLYPDQEKKDDEVSKDKEEAEKGEGEDKDSESKNDEEIIYDLKAPEGSNFEQGKLDKIVSFSKEQGLSKEQAQALVDRDAKMEADQKTELLQKSQQWVEDVKSDKEIGGEKFGTSVEHAKRIISKYASEDFKKVLNDTGLGNHPELVRLLARVGKDMGSDEFVNAPQGHAPQRRPKTIADRLYGNTTPN